MSLFSPNIGDLENSPSESLLDHPQALLVASAAPPLHLLLTSTHAVHITIWQMQRLKIASIIYSSIFVDELRYWPKFLNSGIRYWPKFLKEISQLTG